MKPAERDTRDGRASWPARSACWSPPPSSRSASTCPTRRSWSSSTPSASASPSSTSSAAASGGATGRRSASSSTRRRSARSPATGSRIMRETEDGFRHRRGGPAAARRRRGARHAPVGHARLPHRRPRAPRRPDGDRPRRRAADRRHAIPTSPSAARRGAPRCCSTSSAATRRSGCFGPVEPRPRASRALRRRLIGLPVGRSATISGATSPAEMTSLAASSATCRGRSRRCRLTIEQEAGGRVRRRSAGTRPATRRRPLPISVSRSRPWRRRR